MRLLSTSRRRQHSKLKSADLVGRMMTLTLYQKEEEEVKNGRRELELRTHLGGQLPSERVEPLSMKTLVAEWDTG